MSIFTAQRKFRTLRNLNFVPLEIHVNEIQWQSLVMSVLSECESPLRLTTPKLQHIFANIVNSFNIQFLTSGKT